MKLSDMPVVTLSNGLRVANFSSPHPFTFEDGTVLPACEADRATGLMLNADEVETPAPCGRYKKIKLHFKMSAAVNTEIERIGVPDDIDIILVPLPVLNAIREKFLLEPETSEELKFATIRVKDRVTKAIHINRFCV